MTRPDVSGRRAVRVLIADDHPLVRAELGLLVEAEPDLELVGLCANGADAVEALEAARPDVVVLDLHMPGLDGAQAAAEIVRRRPGTRIWVHTAAPHSARARRAVAAGATGVVAKNADPTALLEALRR